MTWLTIVWALIKSNAGAVIGWLLGKWQTLLVAAGLIVSVFAFGYLWHAKQVSSFKKSVIAEQESDSMRELNKEVSRLVAKTNQLNEAYHEQIQTIDDLERRADANRVRISKSERDAAIATGSAEAVRHYAEVAGDVYQSCRDEYRALGYEAARGSAAAYTLKDWIDSNQKAKEFDDKLTTFTKSLKGTK